MTWNEYSKIKDMYSLTPVLLPVTIAILPVKSGICSIEKFLLAKQSIFIKTQKDEWK